MSIFFLFILIPVVFVVYNFVYYLQHIEIKTDRQLFYAVELWTVVIVPIIYLLMTDIDRINDCCGDTALFSPDHSIGIYILLIAYTSAYVVSMFRKTILPPLLELLLNSMLILGFILNILVILQIGLEDLNIIFWGIGNIPIILLLIIRLNENQKLLKRHIASNDLTSNHSIGRFSLKILNLNPIYKYPILTILLVPIIILLSLFLLLFGQKPDSLIRAFTETYKQGFSQLDHLCVNVECGGHFLCSVGANGHKTIVKPIRYGERNGNKIICNRQLLVSNAFEELVQEKFPKLHKMIRSNYNKVGDAIHKHYHVFNRKYVSDFVYILMKPLELIFLLTLYTFDNKPENRIAKQYLSKMDRQKLNEIRQGL